MRALVLDDSPTQRLVLKLILAHLGFEVIEAADGREGLARLAAVGSADLALVDWNMPQMNGLQFVEAVRADRRWDSMPLLMVTAETELEQVARALAAGANEYIMKPFTKESIQEKLQILGVGRH
jgi:two-component system chemotaxis response regulator CheY